MKVIALNEQRRGDLIFILSAYKTEQELRASDNKDYRLIYNNAMQRVNMATEILKQIMEG